MVKFAGRWGRRGRFAPIREVVDCSRGSAPASASGLTLPSTAFCRHQAQRHPGCSVSVQPIHRDVTVTAQAAQAAKCGPASRARPLGGGWGSSPRWVRILSITGRSMMAAMVFSSPAPQFGQVCMSMSKRSFSED